VKHKNAEVALVQLRDFGTDRASGELEELALLKLRAVSRETTAPYF
jgi:hypothetical protein